MLHPLANGFVLVVIGLVIGALSSLFNHITGIATIPQQLEGESIWQSVLRRHETEQTLIKKSPRAANLIAVTASVFIALLVTLLYFTPVGMRWVPFLAAVFIGLGLVEGIYYLARAGKLKFLQRLVDRISIVGDGSS
jgi:hypothetical protein